ncbi:MAG TPA: MOFRL family protein, partial [Desulfomicrobiaceae bacterium]|nr:MOFRL family protein [Desulfomicrobiaceae bacterium]
YFYSFYRGHDPHWHLANNDASPMLDEIGALVRTGPTGTNVMDVVGFLVE